MELRHAAEPIAVHIGLDEAQRLCAGALAGQEIFVGTVQRGIGIHPTVLRVEARQGRGIFATQRRWQRRPVSV